MKKILQSMLLSFFLVLPGGVGAMGKLFVVSGPSGVGKTTVVNKVLEILKDKHDITQLVTYTTRKPRKGEVNGVDYNFVSVAAFKSREKQGLFLETNNYCENFYGSPRPKKADLISGKSFFIIVDIEGVKRIAQESYDKGLIWIAPPDMKALEERLKKRRSETFEKIRKRLTRAEKEMIEAKSISFDHVVVNDDLEKAVKETVALVKKHLCGKVKK